MLASTQIKGCIIALYGNYCKLLLFSLSFKNILKTLMLGGRGLDIWALGNFFLAVCSSRVWNCGFILGRWKARRTGWRLTKTCRGHRVVNLHSWNSCVVWKESVDNFFQAEVSDGQDGTCSDIGVAVQTEVREYMGEAPLDDTAAAFVHLISTYPQKTSWHHQLAGYMVGSCLEASYRFCFIKC